MGKRAVVLGGGGVTGIAWELGLLAGLCEAGVDLRQADLVVGTSAGSVVGVSVAAGLDLDARYRIQLEPATGERAAVLGRGALLRFAIAMIGAKTPERFRQRVGRRALRASTVHEDERVAIIESRLPVKDWPERPLRLTAIDPETGALRVFDRDSGAPLVRAVAASCAVPGVWPPVTVNGRRYMDGGIRSGTNADLAAGCDRIVIIAPISRSIGPIKGVAAEVAELQRSGAKVAVITPDADALKAIGRNVLDPARRADAARAGRAQAKSATPSVDAIWSG